MSDFFDNVPPEFNLNIFDWKVTIIKVNGRENNTTYSTTIKLRLTLFVYYAYFFLSILYYYDI